VSPRITFDPEANATYIRLDREGPATKTTVLPNGTIVDLDSEGRQIGFEFLCVREMGIPLGELPRSVRSLVTEFINSGALDSATFVALEVNANDD
jgi:uncharacterized protein YuzE